MNNIKIIALLDDFKMSAYLAKASSLKSYQLHFFEENEEINYHSMAIFIIDMDFVSNNQLQKIVDYKKGNSIFVLGYKRDLDVILYKDYTQLGYDMVLDRKNLINNLIPVVSKISNG